MGVVGLISKKDEVRLPWAASNRKCSILVLKTKKC